MADETSEVTSDAAKGGKQQASKQPKGAQKPKDAHKGGDAPKPKDRRSGITARAEDFSQWYLDVIARADLAHHSAVRGCMVIKPYGYALWERIRDELDAMIKATGHVNAYFPLFIPLSFLEKEAAHVDGFAMECAIVTNSRLEKGPDGKLVPASPLEEPLIVRPTSETIIWHTVKDWVQSWRDLPVLLNQWANVVRWEMRTRLFLRTAEFLWQEGHTAHATHEEALDETLKMLEVYRTLLTEIFSVHVIPGRKSRLERFPGAIETFSIEALMQDGKALQAGTSHDLGQNFAKAFDVAFTSQAGQREHVWTTSWGVSTRLIGALIMAHSDDNGLVLPPRLAPIQVVVVPFMRKEEDKAVVAPALARIEAAMKAQGLRYKIDDRDHLTPGNKFYEWEGKGVPLRIEVGPKDLEKGNLMLVRRDNGEKAAVPEAEALATLKERLDAIQTSLYARHKGFVEQKTTVCRTYDELKKVVEADAGFALCAWADDDEAEARVKEETKATIRCHPLSAAKPEPGEVCVVTGKPATSRVLFARSY